MANRIFVVRPGLFGCRCGCHRERCSILTRHMSNLDQTGPSMRRINKTENTSRAGLTAVGATEPFVSRGETPAGTDACGFLNHHLHGGKSMRRRVLFMTFVLMALACLAWGADKSWTGVISDSTYRIGPDDRRPPVAHPNPTAC
jgi:hypothetical protein